MVDLTCNQATVIAPLGEVARSLGSAHPFPVRQYVRHVSESHASILSLERRRCADWVCFSRFDHDLTRAGGPGTTERRHARTTFKAMEYSLEFAPQVLRQTPLVLKAMLSTLPQEWTNNSEGPDAWTPYEVLGHLAYVEESDWIDRTRVILEHGSSRVFEPIDRQGGFERFKGLALHDLLEHFAELRTSNLLLLASLVTVEDLDRRGVHPSFGEVRLDQLLATWVVHDLNHVGQIVKTMAKQYTTAVGPWRAYLPIIDAP
jgi:uncharacterized damage-inducible protein DinB